MFHSESKKHPKRNCRKLLISAVSIVCSLLFLSCEKDKGYSSTRALVEVEYPDDEELLFRLPWPNDVRRYADGTLDLAGFPANTPMVQSYLNTFDGILDGFGTQGAIYFRFSGPLDETSLPGSPDETLKPDATVYLVDITSGSDTYGSRIPLQVSYKDDRQSVGRFSLALLPVHGFPLRPETTYAAIVTSTARGDDGKPIRKGRDMNKLLSRNTPSGDLMERAWQTYAPLRQFLEATGKNNIASAAVFTTQEPVSLMGAIRRVIYEDLPEPPVPLDFDYTIQGNGYHLFSGMFEVPVFQNGEPPYRREGGGIETDENDRPILVRTEPIRFAVSIPEGEMPDPGWPIVIYAHGTGGDYLSFHRSGAAANLAQIAEPVEGGFAVLGVDQVQHGTRCGELTCNPEMDFFNFNNPIAGRDNVRQGGADNFQAVRLIKNMNMDPAPGAEIPIRFDPEKIYFMGHSQGGLTGPPFLAYEPEVKAAVLSGAGGNMILSMLQKDEPVDIPTLVTIMLGEDFPVDRFHPVLTLIQTFIEPADAINYGRLITTEPPDGCGPTSIYQSQGLVDRYTPPDLMEALGVSLGLTWVGRRVTDNEVFALAGQADPQPRPVSGNIGGGEATGVFIQYSAPEGRDGHFVVFDLEEARRDYALFLATAAVEGIPVF